MRPPPCPPKPQIIAQKKASVMTLRHHNRNKALCTWYFVKGFSTTVACTETLSATASQTMSMGSYKSIFWALLEFSLQQEVYHFVMFICLGFALKRNSISFQGSPCRLRSLSTLSSTEGHPSSPLLTHSRPSPVSPELFPPQSSSGSKGMGGTLNK